MFFFEKLEKMFLNSKLFQNFFFEVSENSKIFGEKIGILKHFFSNFSKKNYFIFSDF